MNKPTGLVTFLFTDVEGSTKLAQDFPAIIQSALDKHHSIMQKAIESNNGFVFEIIGDAFCSAFENANDAVNAAVEAQVNLSNEKWEGPLIKVRIGIHSGNSEWNGKNYMGYITLARTARVMSAAYGEQILISDDGYYLLNNSDHKEISFRDLGERRLKDVIQPIRLYQILAKNLREEFPPLKTLDARPNNLPIQLTSFIGREDIMKQTKDLLIQTRLLTILGSGGSGKTRLALQTGADIIDGFANGVFIIEFAPVSKPSLLLQQVMNSLGVREEPGKSPQGTLTDHLRDKEILLIFDNCEHLIHECANLAEGLIRGCKNLKIIATSREALNCQGEQSYRIPALSTPDSSDNNTPEQIVQYESVRLFIERALSVNPGFRVNKNNCPALAEICRRLDGIPLALELAATRTKVMSVEKIYERLDDMFNLFCAGKRTALPRQQTLKALIDWSYDLLSEKEKIMWCRLPVFSGGWTLESAEEICSDEKIKMEEILDLLGQLSEKSIIIYNDAKERYNILETMKQYGESRLMESSERAGLASKHLEYFYSHVNKSNVTGHGAPEWLSKLDSDHNNLISAIESSVNGGDNEMGAQLAGLLGRFWDIRGYYSSGLRLMEMLINNSEGISTGALANLNINIAGFSREQGNYEKARMHYSKSLELYKELGENLGQINSIVGLANTEAGLGNFEQAEKFYEDSLLLSLKNNYASGIAFSLNNLGNISLLRGDYDKAEKYIKDSIDFHHKTGNKRSICYALDSLGNIMKEKGNLEQAEKYLTESLEISREIGDKSGIAFALHNLAGVVNCDDNFEQALKYNEESLKLRIEMGDKPGIAYSMNHIGRILFEQKKYSESHKYLEESLRLRIESGDRHAILYSLISYSLILTYNNHLSHAAKILGAIETGFKNLGLPMNNEELKHQKQLSNELREKLSDKEFSKYYEEGKMLTLEKASKIALSVQLQL